MKRIICVLLVTVLIVSMLLSCSMPLRNSGEEKQRIVVQLDQDYWLASVGKMLKEHFPDVEFDFVISRGGAQYLNDAALNDDLADIIIDASSWTQTSLSDDDYDINPKDYLYDFSWTDITNMFYRVYLDGFTNEDGSVNKSKVEFFSPGANPSYGAEQNGLVASLNSVAKLPYEYALDGISNTQTINPDALGHEESEQVTNLVNVLNGYFDQGAHHLNVNVFGKEKLIDAMEHPEKEEYANFTIRVSGYAVKFIDLTREQQLDVISRTCHASM